MTVITLAGRRIDEPDTALARFALEHVGVVRDRLASYFRAKQPSGLVCAAACGADLLALDTARHFDIARHVVLPFSPELFRARSVVDRPGHWGDLFDRVVADARQAGTLRIEALDPADASVFELANERILVRALALSGERSQLRALVVWDGAPRPERDVTLAFANSARGLGLVVDEISTR
jgi:hypothetical protein